MTPQDTIEKIRRASYDPGQYFERGRRDGVVSESIDGWRARAIVAALEKAGFVIVPKEPGDVGSIAGARSIRDTMHDTNFAARARDTYRSMIEAHTMKKE